MFIVFLELLDSANVELTGVGTLLGPEATRVVVSGSHRGQDSTEFIPLPGDGPSRGLGGGCAQGGWVFWLVFENCIVDASIFDRLWCKLLRAYGGCLGIRSR